MFGHVDAGCLHVRPALDLKDPEDEKLVRVISDRVNKLCKKYGGVIWVSMVQGFISEYKKFLGDQLYNALKRGENCF